MRPWIRCCVRGVGLSWLFAVSVVACTSGSAITATAGAPIVESASPIAPPVVAEHRVTVSWAQDVESPRDGLAKADVVLIGRVIGISSEGADAESPALPATTFTLSVERALKGTPGVVIQVKQTGGRDTSGALTIVDDDPLLTVGEHDLLFLHRITSGPYAGAYFVIGGADGRIAIAADGTLMPRGNMTLPRGATLESVITELGQD